jgi:hypothetical protein
MLNNVEHLHVIAVLSFEDEFRDGSLFCGIQEKIRQGLSERASDDEFRRSNTGSDGTQPRAEEFHTCVGATAAKY